MLLTTQDLHRDRAGCDDPDPGLWSTRPASDPIGGPGEVASTSPLADTVS